MPDRKFPQLLLSVCALDINTRASLDQSKLVGRVKFIQSDYHFCQTVLVMHGVLVWKTMLNRQSCFSITLRLSVLCIIFMITNFVNNIENYNYMKDFGA